MIDLDIQLCIGDAPDERQRYIADGPIDFASWLQMATDIDTELVRGVVVDRMAVQYPHESLFAWLMSVLGIFVSHQKLGVVLGSRTAVKIGANDGRLPDLLFVRADNLAIIHRDAIYGVPDLVIEIISPNDRPSDLISLEADYCALGVPEILFLDPKKQRVRYLRKRAVEKADIAGVMTGDYEASYLTSGPLTSVSIPGFQIKVEWLFTDERPDEFTVVKELIEQR